jgi:PadR family transcriptional regulator, regulatory protein PadR
LFVHILNIVKHIQDYYAPLIAEFEQVVLLSLLRLGNGAWGAAIRRDIQQRIGRELPVSVVYVTLERMEKKGMVKSYVGEPTAERGGRRRRHYLIDTPGEHALGRSYRTLKKMAEGLEDLLEQL